MKNLLSEGADMIGDAEDDAARDAVMIAAAQKVEHYEIASYGTLAALAKELGYDDAVPLILDTLKEEKSTDEKLTKLAEQRMNKQASEHREAKRA
jgi:ferritin-like metal-binding protein YciE